MLAGIRKKRKEKKKREKKKERKKEKKGKRKKKKKRGRRDKLYEKRFVAGQHKSIIMQLHRFHTV